MYRGTEAGYTGQLYTHLNELIWCSQDPRLGLLVLPHTFHEAPP